MKKLAIGIVSLVLGSSSLVAAKPIAPAPAPVPDITTRDHRHDDDRFDGDLDFDGRFDDRFDRFDGDNQAWRRPRWVALGTVGAGRQELSLGRLGLMRQLRLDLSGNIWLRRVVVQYADGHEETIRVNKLASQTYGQPVMIDLARGRGHMVTKVTLFSRSDLDRWGFGYPGNHRTGRIEVSGLRMPRMYRTYR